MMKKKYFSTMIVLLTLLMGINTLIGEQLTFNNPSRVKYPLNIHRPTLYVDRTTPITINSDADLLAFPNMNGTGAVDDPYRIEYWNITTSSSPLISIAHTTKYLSIANNSLNGLNSAARGINLDNVTNAIVKNNTVMNIYTHGIVVDNSKQNIIKNNTVFNCAEAGIELFNSSNNLISQNIVYNNGWDGIRLIISSHNNMIENNTAYGNTWNGIRVEHDNRNNTIDNNKVFGNLEGGIRLEDYGIFRQDWNASQPTVMIYNGDGTPHPGVGDFVYKLDEWGFNWMITGNLEPNTLQLTNMLIVNAPTYIDPGHQQNIKNWWFSGNHTIWVAGDSDYGGFWNPDTVNHLLGNLSSKIIIQDDAIDDPVENDGASYRVIANETNTNLNALFSAEKQQFQFHGPAPVAPNSLYPYAWGVGGLETENTTWLINSSAASQVLDQDNDNGGPWESYPIGSSESYTLMAMETVNESSTILVSGEAIYSEYKQMFGKMSMHTNRPYTTIPFIKNLLNHTLYEAEISSQSVNWRKIIPRTTNNTISNNWVSNNAVNGIEVFKSINNTVFNNTVVNNNESSIQVSVSYNCSVINNTINSSKGWGGIFLYRAYQCDIINNTAHDNINNSIVLESSGFNVLRENTIYKSNYAGIRITTESRNNTVVDNTVYENKEDGIRVESSGYTIITNNTIYTNGWIGIRMEFSRFSFVDRNIIYNNSERGILMRRSSFSVIADNTIYNDTINGIVLRDSSHTNKLINNTIYDHNGSGIFVWESSNDVEIINNTVYKNAYSAYGDPDAMSADISLYFVSGAIVVNNTAHSSYDKGIALWEGVNHSVVENNTVFNNTDNGIFANISNNNFIFNNTIYNNSEIGMRIDSSNNSLIANNTVFDTLNNRAQIGLFWSRNNTIIDNKVFNGTGFGIMLGILADNNTVSHNTAFNNTNGIALVLGDNNTVVNNNASHNTRHGIWVRRANNNSLWNNNVTNNNETGIDVSLSNNTIIENNNVTSNNEGGIILNSSSYNLIENNNVHDNANRAQIGLLDSSMNNTLVGNNVFNGDLSGIFVFYSKNNTVSHNTAFNNTYAGVTLYYSDNNTLDNNNASHNIGRGMSIEFSDDNVIMNNNVTHNKEEGIVLNSSSTNLIENNLAYNNTIGAQIWLDYSDENTLYKNIVYNGDLSGIFLGYSDNNTVSHNTAYSNSFGGISLYYSDDNKVLENNATHNFGFGVWISSSYYNIIDNNSVNNNSKSGIALVQGASDNIIANNTISNNTLYGIVINSTSSDNIITYNDFIDNNPTGSQGFDEGYTIIYQNYWDDWTTPDSDGNGLVDAPYGLEGNAFNFDHFPLTNPNTGTPIHFLSSFNIISPNGGEILAGMVTFSWMEALDSLPHDVTYTVYLSVDGGTTWVLLASNLVTTTFDWDTTTVSDGSNYLIKVVATCSDNLTIEDTSNAVFSVINTPSHTLLLPMVTYPNGSETLSGTVTIQWLTATDSLNHGVTYEVFFSSDGGITWTSLASGISGTSYSWVTTNFADGTNYLIKVKATCSEGLSVEDISDSTFTVDNGEPTTTAPTTTTEETETIPPTTSESTIPETLTISPSPGMTSAVLIFSMLIFIGLRKKQGK